MAKEKHWHTGKSSCDLPMEYAQIVQVLLERIHVPGYASRTSIAIVIQRRHDEVVVREKLRQRLIPCAVLTRTVCHHSRREATLVLQVS